MLGNVPKNPMMDLHGALTGRLSACLDNRPDTAPHPTEPIRRRTQRTFLKPRSTPPSSASATSDRSVSLPVSEMPVQCELHPMENESASGATGIFCPSPDPPVCVQSGGCGRRQRCVTFAGTLPSQRVCQAKHLPWAAMDDAWTRNRGCPIANGAF